MEWGHRKSNPGNLIQDTLWHYQSAGCQGPEFPDSIYWGTSPGIYHLKQSTSFQTTQWNTEASFTNLKFAMEVQDIQYF